MAAGVAELAAVAARFAFEGKLTAAAPLGRGHIHDSYLLAFDAAAGVRRYVLQRINTHVFADPRTLMHNVARVAAHLRSKLSAQGEHDVGRRCVTLVVTNDGETEVRDAHGGWWRAWNYIEGSVTHESIGDERQAYSAARAYGEFQRLLADLPAPRLAETIPDFHVTPQRLRRLEAAVALDPGERAARARAEIDLALAHRPVADALLAMHRAGALPERIVHNDTKLNNVLFDARSDQALCVVDLDTVMPGLGAWDFGDLVRSCALAREDSAGADGVHLDLGLFESLLRGYLEGAGDMLTTAECEVLPLGCKVMAYELGMRFLTDYLEGDVYFKTEHAEHNLERARVQLDLMEAIARQEAAMQRIVNVALSRRAAGSLHCSPTG
jgi:Ser/Thr protein kinase RdoA (MazF antagonist)